MMAAGMSKNQAASVIWIDPTCIGWWRGQSLAQLPPSSGENLSLQRHPSTQGFLDDIEPDLLGFIEGWRQVASRSTCQPIGCDSEGWATQAILSSQV